MSLGIFALAKYCLSVADEVRFVGLTPGILVCIGVSRWLSSIFAGRRGRIRGGKQGSLIRTLRSARTPDHLTPCSHAQGTSIVS